MFVQRVFILVFTLFGLLLLIGCTAAQPAAPPTEAPISEPTEATEEPTVEATEEATAEATEEPTTEATEEATAETTEEPTMEATEEPTAEATEEATAEATEEATAEATEEATAEATEEAAAEDTEAGEPVTEQIEVDFVVPLSTIEEVEDIESLLHDVEGIISVRGTEVGLTITYDPEILTPDDVIQQMSIIGYPVEQP